MNLRQIGDYGANILGQPSNHTLKERFKDSFKRVMATRIRQTVEKNGIDDMFKLSFETDIIPLDNSLYGVKNPVIKGVDYYYTPSPIPYPVRFQNDSPFTFVGLNNKPAIYCRMVELKQYHRQSSSFPSIGEVIAYLWINRHLFIVVNRHTPKGLTRSKYDKVRIESIFPDAEELLMMYDLENDGQDIVVPFADDQVETILYEILKTEYHYVPKETVVTINPPIQSQSS